MSRTVEKISKLLALAAGSSSIEEQEAAMAKAEAMAKAAEISLAEVRMRTPEREREQMAQKRVVIGQHRQLANRSLITLFARLGQANGLVVGVSPDNTSVVLFGLPSDMAVVEALYGHIGPQMVRMAGEHVAAGEWRGQMMWDRRNGYRPVTARRAKTSFMQGFAQKIGDRVDEAAAQARADHFHQGQEGQPVEQGQGAPGAEVVLRAKEVEVRGYADRFLRGTWRGSRGSDPHHGSWHAGHRAGDRASLGGQPDRALAGAGRELGR